MGARTMVEPRARAAGETPIAGRARVGPDVLLDALCSWREFRLAATFARSRPETGYEGADRVPFRAGAAWEGAAALYAWLAIEVDRLWYRERRAVLARFYDLSHAPGQPWSQAGRDGLPARLEEFAPEASAVARRLHWDEGDTRETLRAGCERLLWRMAWFEGGMSAREWLVDHELELFGE